MSKLHLQQAEWQELFVKITQQTEGMIQAELELEKALRVSAWQKLWIPAAIMGNEEAKRMLAQGPPS
jgi:hypothetical protein